MRPFLLLSGPLFIAASFVLTLQRVEPFATFFYLVLYLRARTTRPALR